MNYEIKQNKEKQELVVRIPLRQKSYDAVGEEIGDTDNLIGIVAGDDFTISQLIDLGYKGVQQEGMPILYFESREELEKVCKTAGIQIWEYSVCSQCGNVLRGTHTWGENGAECFGHETRGKIKVPRPKGTRY